MTCRTESVRTVAVGARCLPGIGRRGMPGQKAGGMVSSCRRRGRPVAIEALRPGMARGAGLGRRGRDRRVAVSELCIMAGGPGPDHLSPASPPCPRRGESAGLPHTGHMARGATLLGVAGPAGTGGFSRLNPMTIDEVGRGVRGRCGQLRAVEKRPRVAGQCPDRPLFGRIYMALSAEFPRMTGRAARWHGTGACLDHSPMSFQHKCGIAVAFRHRKRPNPLLREPGRGSQRHVAGRARAVRQG
jgi:hypothetical protein